MAPMHKSSEAGNLNVPRRSYKVHPLSEKVKVLVLIKKGRNYMPRLLGSVEKTNLPPMKL